MQTVYYKSIDENLEAFNKAYADDAGYDMYVTKPILLLPLQTRKIPVNIKVAIPSGKFGWLTGRSSVAASGILVHTGIIDSGYTGQIKAVVTNLTLLPKMIRPGQRIAQLIFLDKADVLLKETYIMPITLRNTRGFGSSGA
ncbi:Deoxyuridine 5'-triphosphate nucleotidohydrolase [Moorella thermoacetica]|uniref:dUTP diphosphatase n=1 Tax=Neomoorella thermoacetica TaxID=1525 RepID=A0AAC9HIQ3_NEOTH|nr:hypothetical protein [Moorella thermoacetica]AOQ24623.1 Deoxyuridine 5'-triphosphate nucleotidohydrolase [Moorella thermoacetica]TYL12726.1 Deoxyuridine 5'-triphosphate nucleotidohydrolase [Moorella thermoacetica]